MPDSTASASLRSLSDYLGRYYGKRVLIFLDEYDTPMQEAYVNGYWKELADFARSLLNSTFKTNPYMERAVLTGITRVSKESIFSDLNHLEAVTAVSKKYTDCFGFTEEEVSAALEEYGLLEPKKMPSSGTQRKDAILIEFKVQEEGEKDLAHTAADALRQIEEKGYAACLAAKGIPEECIRRYGFAFCGKMVYIESGAGLSGSKEDAFH